MRVESAVVVQGVHVSLRGDHANSEWSNVEYTTVSVGGHWWPVLHLGVNGEQRALAALDSDYQCFVRDMESEDA